LHAKFLAARLQDIEQALAADAAKAMAARAYGLALEVDLDIVPVVERLQDGARVGSSALARLPRVWSENTTPQPNVSYGRLRSMTVMRCSGFCFS